MAAHEKKRPPPRGLLRFPEFRYLLVSGGCRGLAERSLEVVLGYQVYALTGDPLALGGLGLVGAIPALSLSLFGGHLADRYDRRTITLVTQAVLAIGALVLALNAFQHTAWQLFVIYAVVAVVGLARGFYDPAMAALETQIVPRELMVSAAAWLSSASEASGILGPVLGGLASGLLGVTETYLLLALLFAISWLSVLPIAAKPAPAPVAGESMLRSIAIGVYYVARSPILVGSMALDLFAVLFGGAIALLPIFASDILKVGPQGLGLLYAAPAVGSLLVMLWSIRYPPVAHAGRNLLVCVAGFGLATIVFALSDNLLLSLVALALTGLFDGLNMVIRRAIVRLLAPPHLRGRVAAVSQIFIGSSNELGALESGVAARLFGPVPAVWLGGVVTLLVVGLTALAAPQLRHLSLEPENSGGKTRVRAV